MFNNHRCSRTCGGSNQPWGWTKCNVDAGFFMDIGITSVTSCFRNDNGTFLCAQTRCYNSQLTTLKGEGMSSYSSRLGLCNFLE
ncbi:hypothetical protein A2U01_0027139 [Trifolium medium]|uniref:Uncharacterized protein n=1 Tax=Trifolium medium TaxID=97028 RepID=A0A392P2X1_9FABA|nr:hypothetical protein [Trifolium medium]